MPIVTDIPTLRKHVDDVADVLPLFGLPRSEALAHVFRIAQAGHTMQTGRSTPAQAYQDMRAVQDLLRWLTYKIADKCSPGARLRDTTDKHREIAREAIELFDTIAKVNEFMLIVESGRCRMECDPNARLVTFRYHDDIPSRRLARRLLRQDHERQALMSSRIEQSFREDGALINELVPHVRPRWGDRDFICRPGRSLEAKVREYMAGAAEPELLPADWSAGGYTLGEHRRFWNHLQALAWLRELGLVACAKLRPDRIPWNGAALVLSVRELLDRVETLEIVPRAAAAEIVRDLTYNPREIPWTDVMYQPLVPLDGDTLLTLPLLITGNRFDRNLLAIIDRLPWRKAEARSLKDGREQLMIDAIVPVADSVGLLHRARVRLEEQGNVLTDIDLLLWQPNTQVALAVSLKWFYGPDSIREVLTHDEWYEKGIRIAKRSIAHLSANVRDVSRRYRIDPALSESSQVLGCIVGHHDVPSDWVRDSATPVVKLDAFLQALEGFGLDLRAVHERLCAISGIDDPADDAEVPGGHDDVKLGDLTVRMPFQEASSTS